MFHLLAMLLLGFQAPSPAVMAKAPPTYAAVGTQKVDVNLPALKFFCDGKQGDLKRYLEASPRWRVGVERRGDQELVVAYRRSGTRITLNGYLGTKSQTRMGFEIAESPFALPFTAPCVTSAAPTAGSTSVSICSYSLDPKERIARLQVGTPGLWLATHEIDTVGTLEKTPGMLAEVETELAAVQKAVVAGDVLSALAATDTRQGTATLTIDDNERQILHLEAWLNPGEAGVTEVRVKSGDGTKDLTVSHEHLYARERIGYSSKPEQLFYANSLFSIRETSTGWQSKHDVLFQLWFKPDAGGPERKLIELRKTIWGYEH